MRVMIRADASAEIGSGHVMRCLCLARLWRKQGHTVDFWCMPLAGDMRAYIFLQGFAVHEVIPRVATSDLCEADATYCLEKSDGTYDLVVVDHYGLDRQWEIRMRSSGRVLMALDDFGAREHDCDILLDQSAFPGMGVSYDGLVPASCRQLLGPTYCLLPDAFQHLLQPIRYRKQVRHLLLFFGGGDPGNVTGRVLEEVAALGIYTDVVIGVSNPNRDAIKAQCDTLGDDLCGLHIQTNRMAELMQRADLMLSAGGTTHWERCRLGLPAVVASVAQNQVAVSAGLAERGTCVYLGDIATVRTGGWRQAVAELLSHTERLLTMQTACTGVVPDGLGCDRVVKAVEEVVTVCK